MPNMIISSPAHRKEKLALFIARPKEVKAGEAAAGMGQLGVRGPGPNMTSLGLPAPN